MLNKKFLVGLILVSIIFILGCTNEKIAKYTPGKIKESQLSYNPPTYSFTPKQYNNPGYDLPLSELPENYQRDLVEKFGLNLNEDQKQQLLENGVVVIPGQEDRFLRAYTKLSYARGSDSNDLEGVPVFITTDSIMHLFHI